MQQTLTLDSIVSMGRSGDATQFIGAATAALAQGVGHDDLRLLLMQRLAERGLLGRARALAEGLSAEVRSHPQYAGMRRALAAGANDGQVPWQRVAPRFAANMAALRRRYDWADQVAAVWEAQQRHLELHVAKDGTWQVFDRREGPRGGWRPAFGDHTPKPSAEELAAQFKNHVLGPLAIEGVGLGYHLPWLYTATADTFLGASALLYLIEPSLLAVAVALHLNDWREPLGDERVRLCCGPDAYEQFERLVAAETWNVPPSTVIQAAPWDPPAGPRAQSRIRTLETRLAAEQAALRESVTAPYRGRARSWWQRRYAAALSGAEPPLRVLGITCRFTTVLQYSMRDALNALKANGCQTRVLIEPNDYARITSRQKLAAIRDFAPDLILLIDHTRQQPWARLIDGVPVVTWVQDRLPWLFDRAVGEAVGPLDFFMGFCRDELVQHYGYPGERFMPCEMATDPAALLPGRDDRARTHPERALEEEDPRLSCDVAFATNYGRPAEAIYEEFCRRSDAACKKLLAAIYEELLARTRRAVLNGGLYVEPFLRAMEQAVGVELSPQMRRKVSQEVVRPMVDQLIRQQTIEWTARWADETGRCFHLYGKGWDAHPEYSKYARGFIEHGPELGRAFRAAKVNLHAGCNPAFHQRVLDGLAAGGFFLIRRHGSDIWYRFKSVVYDLVRRKNLRPGDALQASDMPPALRAEWAAFRQMQGAEPHAPYEITQALVDDLENPYRLAPHRFPAGVWPDFDRVTFGTRAELADRLAWFLRNDDERRELARSMRARMLENFGYPALMSRLLAWLAEAFGHAS